MNQKNYPLPLSAGHFKNPWLLFANGLGDHFLALPAIRALVAVFEGRLSLLCENGELYAGMQFHRVLETPFRIEDGTRRFNAEKVAPEMKECDLFIHLASWPSLSLDELLQWVNPAFTIGFNGNFTISLPYTEHHVADEKFTVPQLFEPSLNIEDFSDPPLLGAPSRPLEKMRRFRAQLSPETSILCVQLFTKECKMWPGEKFASLLGQLLAEQPHLVILVVGGGKELIASEALAGSNRLHFFACTPGSFEISCAVVAVADYFLGIDSVFLHVADLCRLPSVGIFGATPPAKFGPRFSPHTCVVSGSDSVKDIPVEEVYQALDGLMQAYGKTAAV
jgi:ADP-heptose:LPS heptosyltransferase